MAAASVMKEEVSYCPQPVMTSTCQMSPEDTNPNGKRTVAIAATLEWQCQPIISFVVQRDVPFNNGCRGYC
jgi:hypothetical protein